MRRRLFGSGLLVMAIFSMSMVFVPMPASASPNYLAASSADEVCGAIGEIDPRNSGPTCDNGAQSTLQKFVRLAIQLLSIVAGVIAVIMVIVAGLRYITSQGEAAATASAKNALIYALVGVAIVAFAQVIVRFMLSSSTKS